MTMPRCALNGQQIATLPGAVSGYSFVVLDAAAKRCFAAAGQEHAGVARQAGSWQPVCGCGNRGCDREVIEFAVRGSRFAIW